MQLVLLLLALGCGVLSPKTSFGQKNSPDIPKVSTVVAIQGATVVVSPGNSLEDATVVFRNGVIEAVGKRVTVPYDAEVIDGKGLTVYAGFIDALSQIGVPASENSGPQETVPDRSNPTFDQAGITPQIEVRAVLKPSDATVDAFRKLGFTVAHVVPQGRMLPGTGSVVLLSGDDADAMVLQDDQSMFFQFAGARGVYPGTPMGIMAKFRRLYIEANRRIHLNEMYRQNPAGMAKPPSDVVHEAFFPVISQNRPIFVFTQNALEVHRALTLKNELTFNMVLAGLSEGYDTIEKVKASGVPVALTLGVPAKPEWAAKIKADSLEQILASFNDDTRTATFRDIEAEKRNLEAKQLISRKQYLAMPGQFAGAGVPFSFTTFGVKATDVASNLREFTSTGLDREAALAALTTAPASLLGLSASMGSLDVGKMANLVVSTGDIFDEASSVKFVFVNGHKYEYEAPDKKEETTPSRRRGQ